MSMNLSFGLYNTDKKLIKSFFNYQEALQYIKKLKNKDYIEVEYLFFGKEKVKITKILYIQKYFESGGGVQTYGNKYFYNKENI